MKWMIKLKKLVYILLPLLILPIMTLAGCSSRSVGIDYTLSDEPVTLDPQIAEDPDARIVVESLFEGLTRLDENENPYPGAASGWEISADGLTYTFHLREGAQWSDGVPLSAQDFVYAFRRAVQPKTGSTTCDALYCIKNAEQIRIGKKKVSELGVRAIDDRTLEVTLAYADADFLVLCSTTPYMPCRKDYFNSTQGQYGLESGKIIGNGPYVMENIYSWEHGEYINLIRSDTYVGEEEAGPYRVTFTIANDEVEPNPLTRLENKTVSAAYIPETYVSQLLESDYPTVSYTDTTVGLCFNTASSSMKSRRIRRLFLQAIDKKALRSILPNGVSPAAYILPPSTQWNGSDYQAQSPELKLIKQDLKAADGLSYDSIPSVTILCEDRQETKLIANQLITTWNKSFSRYLNIEPLSKSELTARISRGDYDLAILDVTAISEGPRSFLSVFSAENGSNPAHWNDTDYTKLLKISGDSTSADQLRQYNKAEQMLIDQAVFYPIYYKTRYYATASDIQGIAFHPYGLGIDFLHAQAK